MTTVMTAVLVYVICRVSPTRKADFASNREYWISKLPRGTYDRLCDFAPGGSRASDPNFWQESEGVRGICDRLYTSYIYLRIIHLHRRAKRIGKKDARSLWLTAFSQFGYSILALPEAAFSEQYQSGRQALECYFEIMLLTTALCPAPDHKCPLTLSELL